MSNPIQSEAKTESFISLPEVEMEYRGICHLIENSAAQQAERAAAQRKAQIVANAVASGIPSVTEAIAAVFAAHAFGARQF